MFVKLRFLLHIHCFLVLIHARFCLPFYCPVRTRKLCVGFFCLLFCLLQFVVPVPFMFLEQTSFIIRGRLQIHLSVYSLFEIIYEHVAQQRPSTDHFVIPLVKHHYWENRPNILLLIFFFVVGLVIWGPVFLVILTCFKSLWEGTNCLSEIQKDCISLISLSRCLHTSSGSLSGSSNLSVYINSLQ